MLNQTPCPSCGAPNRSGAKFCARCRASLVSQTKPCPRCHASNRADAKFCATCRTEFATMGAPAPASSRTALYIGAGFLGVFAALFVCVLIAVAVTQIKPSPTSVAVATPMATATAAATATIAATFTATPTPTNAPTPTTRALTPVPPTLTSVPIVVPPTDGLERAQRATMQIWVPVDGRTNYFSIGSGTVITKRGHILTNHHLFVDENGKAVSARGEIFIALPPTGDMREKTAIRYRAKMIQPDLTNDLALIQITAMRDNSALPADLGLTVAPLGDSDAVKIGDEVVILGFPSVGGESLTLTRGVISGFLMTEGFIKTDAEINQGNSGGGAYNKMFQLIGVPSRLVQNRQSVGKIGLIRPLKIAQTLIELAKRQAGE